jgi:hypothetical protein
MTTRFYYLLRFLRETGCNQILIPDITLLDYCVPLAAHLVFIFGGNEASAKGRKPSGENTSSVN